MEPAAANTDREAMPVTPEELLARLETLGIDVTLYRHAAFFTVAEGLEVERGMPGAHCRNLFLRDKKGAYFLFTLRNGTKVDLKKLSSLVGAAKFSFGSPEDLWRLLGVRPGSVCPFAIINDTDHVVEFHLDAAMTDTDIVNFHPLINTMTVGLSPANLLRFVESCSHTAHITDMSPAAPDDDKPKV